MKAVEYIFMFLIFPGFLFTAIMGLVVGWVDRKVTARVQWRVGPPWYQNFFDVLKLMLYKETLIPAGVSKFMFLGMPLLALSSMTLVSTIILAINASPAKGFIGDLLVIVYLLMIPALTLILGGFSSANPYASLGASREMKLMLSYELPFILSLIVPIMKSGYVIKLGEIIKYQCNSGSVIASVSGVASFLVMILCVQAKLGFIPFDIAEAETEIISGPYIEYSGKALGIFKLTKFMAEFITPVFILSLYFGGLKLTPAGWLGSILAYVFVLVLFILIKNTNPRVRIDHAMRFFWGPVTILAALSVVLAYFGW